MAGSRTHAPSLDAQGLRAGMRGTVTLPGDPGYDVARRVYNAMIDKRPAAVAACTDVADVMHAVNFARGSGLVVAVRGGGHNGAGFGTCDDGLVIDLSGMNGVRVDPTARTVRVDGGATLGQVDHAAHAFGLATPAGIISTTGFGGLALGGGLGHLTRRHGLSIDNLLEADVVLADGSVVTASEDRETDLFWALRGGGGNFGVVTSMLFRAHPVDDVVGGPMFWELDDAPAVLRWYRDFLPNAPEDLSGFFAFLRVPPAPPFPVALHDRPMCAVVWCYTGPKGEAAEVFGPIREFGPPALDGVQTMPFPMLQSAFDALYPPGHQWYWKADFIDEISDDAISEHMRHVPVPTGQSTVHLYPVDGAAHRVGANDTAWNYRSATWSMVIAGVDPDPANAGTVTRWAQDYWEAIHPHSAGGGYVNMIMDEGPDRVRAAYGDNYPRLARIKAGYDPTNFFRLNQNIRPTGRG